MVGRSNSSSSSGGGANSHDTRSQASGSVVVRPEEMFGSELGTVSWTWNPNAFAHRTQSTLSVVERQGGNGESSPENRYYIHVEDGKRRERTLFARCFGPEGQFIAQSILLISVLATTIVLLVLYASAKEVGPIACCAVMVLLMAFDVHRALVLVLARRNAWSAPTWYLSTVAVLNYVSCCGAAGCFVAFMFTAISVSSLEVILLFVVQEIFYILFFGWFFAFMEIFLPVSAGLMLPIWLILVPFRFLMNATTFYSDEKKPEVTVTQEEVDESVPTSSFEGGSETGVPSECAICIVDFEAGDPVRTLPCHHTFHKECIDPWFLSHHTTCPSCRAPFRPEPKDEASKDTHDIIEDPVEGNGPQSDSEEDLEAGRSTHAQV
mmetsp:Transcript_5449/g.11225  ORF Transcript_5449/g.11225 Transcript_5449/m.11225 type:complete len:379 (+) Transcript_5449:425-1561(+)|eukprot:CAMPEP_0171525030 /NCGR_PEP_ID=MMETSP0959-20130129/9438_1 /TAXON_ID=87120 /ORGANISM="Aurantiochytrium limacinum, Strain ATCCMYA-1381" /LENGTH=378 /DNA_ID=CAMNT_0012065951 /DNA_START=258 /DNA_END=1394 /DNA_ORIENTATION=+